MYMPALTGQTNIYRFRVKHGMTKRFAFTLAEVLITLGIIGIVAAITIPGLITRCHRQRVETKLKKFSSVMNQAVRMSVAEHDDIVFDTVSAENMGNRGAILREWYDENLLRYLKAEYTKDYPVKSPYVKVMLLDGSGFVSYISNSGTVIHFFYCVDVNDKSCKLESYDGRNTFLFNYYPAKKAVLPVGYNIPDINTLKNNSKSMAAGCYNKSYPNRHYCTALIARNGWKIPSDYPWIK